MCPWDCTSYVKARPPLASHANAVTCTVRGDYERLKTIVVKEMC